MVYCDETPLPTVQEQTVKRSLGGSVKVPPIRFESVSAVLLCWDGRAEDPHRALREIVEVHVRAMMDRLVEIQFPRLLSYSYSDEFPELVGASLEWLRLLELKAKLAISTHGGCTYEIVNALAMLTGLVTDMFVGVDRSLTKASPMAAHFRCQGQAIRGSLRVQGFSAVPVDLLFALFDQRRKVVRPRGGRVDHQARDGGLWLACGGMATASFVIRDYALCLINGRRIRKLELDNVPSGMFDFLRHVLRDLLAFVPPSSLPLLFLHILGIQLVQDLAISNGFHVEITAFHGTRENAAFGLHGHRITQLKKGETELEMMGVLEGVHQLATGALPVFHPHNFRMIMDSLQAESARTEGNLADGQNIFVADPPLEPQSSDRDSVEYLRRYVRRVMRKLAPRVLEDEDVQQRSQRYNRTLLVAFFKEVVHYMKALRPPGDSEPISRDTLAVSTSWSGEFLENLWICTLLKARMTHLPGFTQSEDRYGARRYQRVQYLPADEACNPCTAANAWLEKHDAAFSQSIFGLKMGFDRSFPAQFVGPVRKHFVSYSFGLMDAYFASYWQRLSAMHPDEKIKLVVAAPANEEEEIQQPAEEQGALAGQLLDRLEEVGAEEGIDMDNYFSDEDVEDDDDDDEGEDDEGELEMADRPV